MRMTILVGTREYGWVWSDSAGVHVQKPTGVLHSVERYKNFRMFGTGPTLFGFSRNAVLTVDLQYEPPRIASAELVGAEQWRDMDAGEKYLFAVNPRGIEVRSVPELALQHLWPGQFKSVLALPHGRAACSDLAGRVTVLRQSERRWEPFTYNIQAYGSLQSGMILCRFLDRYFWCPEHQHAIYQYASQVACCDNIILFCRPDRPDQSYYLIFEADRSGSAHLIWRVRATAVLLQKDFILVLQGSTRHLQTFARHRWARRVLFLAVAGIPRHVIERIKSKL